jgi:uncharacterized protein YcbX
MRVEELYVAPVKSLAMGRVERVGIGTRGIPGDRAFFLVDEGGRMYSQRDCGALTRCARGTTPSRSGCGWSSRTAASRRASRSRASP